MFKKKVRNMCTQIIEGIPPVSWDTMIKGVADAVKRAIDDGTFWEIIGEAPPKEFQTHKKEMKQ